MIRITNLQLPLDHDDQALNDAILARLSIQQDYMLDLVVHRRGYDARKKTNIVLIYTLDVNTTQNEILLVTFTGDQLIKPSPDMSYKFVAHAQTKAPTNQQTNKPATPLSYWICPVWFVSRFSACSNRL